MIQGSNPGMEKKHLSFFHLNSQIGSVAHVHRGVIMAINSIWCRVSETSLPLSHAVVFKRKKISLICCSVRRCSGNRLVHKKRPCSGWLLLFLFLNGLRNNTVFLMEVTLRLDGLCVLWRIFTAILAEHTASNVCPEDGGKICLRKSVTFSRFLLLYSQRILSIVSAVRKLNLKYSVDWCALNNLTRESECVK